MSLYGKLGLATLDVVNMQYTFAVNSSAIPHRHRTCLKSSTFDSIWLFPLANEVKLALFQLVDVENSLRVWCLSEQAKSGRAGYPLDVKWSEG